MDLAIWAHEHSYERLFPLYDTAVYNGSNSEPYTNPRGLTHIITGSAVSVIITSQYLLLQRIVLFISRLPTFYTNGLFQGCQWEHDAFPEPMPSWSAFRTLDYGYSRMRVINSTHLYFEQVSIDQVSELTTSCVTYFALPFQCNIAFFQQENAVIDSFTLVRERHEAYGPY